MAIDVKSIIADALLDLCEKKPLSKITIADIQDASGVSRQTFYNHFKDKYDLIQYVYEHRVIALFTSPEEQNMDYYHATLRCFQSDIKYRVFMRQAIKMTGANSLVDFMYEHSWKFDRTWHQSYYGSSPMPSELVFASDYHSAAAMYARLRWIADNMPIPPEELVENILRMRLFSFNDRLFGSHDEKSPYVAAAKYVPALYEEWKQWRQRGTL